MEDIIHPTQLLDYRPIGRRRRRRRRRNKAEKDIRQDTT
jgi:hypothetical protein